ncbi:hypothetical protein C5167_031846 [Papaver somniferum]|uniref:J domain-containing protein n=1 Tax=Papaver somniferum TaxID=3469 RepID=A0A4Y7K8K8_PAPSO|nr:chaperone protein dnaJ 20, chloroplastic-like [Papaver somniferum]RZC68662.1 hypothetical protein C5167_031846 [Papaver somniferum]
MSSGVISEYGSFCLQLKPHQPLSTTSRNPSSNFVFFKTYYSKPNLLLENHGFKTKATINEQNFLLSEDDLSFYQLLGIPEGVSFVEIKQAYKQLARKYHPDVSPPDRTEEYTRRFIQVTEAYEILSDPTRRAMYDKDLARGLHLAFSARKRYNNPNYHQNDEGLDNRGDWKNRWQSQLTGLKRKNMNQASGEKMSWAARMRKLRNQPSGE